MHGGGYSHMPHGHNVSAPNLFLAHKQRMVEYDRCIPAKC